MQGDARTQAEQRLEAAFTAHALADTRGALRGRLKELRERAPAAFDRALDHYENRVLPALAGAAAPAAALAEWIGYGAFLGQLDGAGRTLALAGDGRATDFAAPYVPGTLVLFLPDDAATGALTLALPQQPTPAQHAAVGLLVEGRLGL
jgi:hypothetical protein